MTRILVAEDEKDIRDLVMFTLKFSGFEVTTVANGAEALEAAAKEIPDLILMDGRMPHMTGYEACRRLKADPLLRDIPVVFLSAKGQEAEINEGIQSGALEYLLKPFAPDELIRKIKEILEQTN
ncbi:MAG: response regulator [Anaerolineaceae bacterium]|nr:response regulator [Anaerolineaceae bacterium]